MASHQSFTRLEDHIPDSDTVHPVEVMAALSVIAANVFSQRRSIIADFLEIEHRMYRLLRLLPFVALIDSMGCIVAMSVVWHLQRRGSAWKTEPKTVQHPLDKSQAKKNGSVGKSRSTPQPCLTSLSFKPSKRSILVLLSMIQLFKLTVCHGIPFSSFCGWTFFTSYILNDLGHHYALPFLGEQDDTFFSPRRSPTQVHKPIMSKTDFRLMVRTLLMLAFVAELFHLAYLAQYLVPRRLWMDWGSPQTIEIDRRSTALVFPVPPGMPPCPQDGEGLVVGFWPQHTVSGSVSYFVTGVVLGCLLSVVLSAVLVPVIGLPLAIWWLLHLRMSFYIDDMDRRGRTDIWVVRCSRCIGAIVASLHNRLAVLPGWAYSCVWLSANVAFWLLLYLWMLAPLVVMCVPMFQDNQSLFGIIPVVITLINMFNYFMGHPEGSYTTLAGSLITTSVLVIRFGKIPGLVSRPDNPESIRKRRYWTMLWVMSMMCFLSVLYYEIYAGFDVVRKPNWLQFAFFL